MTVAIPAKWPHGAALWHRLARNLMDVILHLGAHRTGTTTFQHYMRDHVDALADRNVGYWGPKQSRKSVFPGLFRSVSARKGRNMTQRAEGRIRMFCHQARSSGVQHLLISDENLLGSCVQNLRYERLYPAAGERTARISAAFAGRVRRIVVSIRAQDLWWASACAMTVSRGHRVPTAPVFAAIADNRRTWRDVITDLACAAPGADIAVMPFETFAGRPDLLLSAALEGTAPPDTGHRWLNRSADLRDLRASLAEQGTDPGLLPDTIGRWQPFTPEQAARLRENYADDLHWLKTGADGLATLTEDVHPKRADKSLPPGAMIKGQEYDQGQMAQHR